MNQQIVEWRCERCGNTVSPDNPFLDRGRVCPRCKRVICRRCTAQRTSRRSGEILCRDCVEGNASDTAP